MQHLATVSKFSSLALIALIGAGAAGCDSKAEARAAGSADPSASARGSAAAVAAPVVPKDGDPTVVAALRKLSSCERDGGYLKANCESESAWDEFRDKFIEEDDLKLTKTSKLVRACFSLVADDNDSVREAATACVGRHQEALEDKRSAIMVLIGRLESDKSEGVRSTILSALDDLDPVKHGGADEVLAMAKRMATREDTSGVVRDLMDALTPDPNQGEPNASTVAYAIELTKDSNNTHRATGAAVLGSAKSKASEACPALLSLIQTKKYPWHEGLRAMASLEGACKAQYDDVVTVVLAKMAEGEGYDQGFGVNEASYLTRMLAKPGFTPEQKTKLLGPAEKLHAAATKDHVKTGFAELVAQLKK